MKSLLARIVLFLLMNRSWWAKSQTKSRIKFQTKFCEKPAKVAQLRRQENIFARIYGKLSKVKTASL